MSIVHKYRTTFFVLITIEIHIMNIVFKIGNSTKNHYFSNTFLFHITAMQVCFWCQHNELIKCSLIQVLVLMDC